MWLCKEEFSKDNQFCVKANNSIQLTKYGKIMDAVFDMKKMAQNLEEQGIKCMCGSMCFIAADPDGWTIYEVIQRFN